MKVNKKGVSTKKAIIIIITIGIIVSIIFEFIIAPAHFSGSSMEPNISENDLAIIYYQPNDIKVGDIVVFESKVSNVLVGHRVIEIKNEMYYTKGDNNSVRDIYPLTKEEIDAIVVLIIPTSKLFS